jgi:purine-cytosine permease-like protein
MHARFAGYKMKLPGHPLVRMGLGAVLVIGGFLGFLPVLGFWMVPLGLAILAVDFPPVRRFYRRTTVRFGAWVHRKFPRHAQRFGFGKPRPGKHT